ncbi:MAG: TIGR03960 family B12-binding radical SAM protein [Thermoleophilia bacterium]
MREDSYRHRFLELLGRISQPARLIGNELGSGPGFGRDATELRVVLGFPDTYEIGISNQALQILYHLAAEVQGVAVERTYLPWIDVLHEMRTACVPLLTLETWSLVAEADLLALTLQHEFNYTNVLELLELAGLPVRAGHRTDGDPLVLGGGPTTANFFPVAPFFDALTVGDGEELFPEILAVLTAVKREGAPRSEALSRLSRIKGVYVPGLSTSVARRVLPHIEDAAYPTSCLVPLSAGVHDRAWVEVMRGCTRGCRFCQAGMWYRPVRERSWRTVLDMATTQLAVSGRQELALASLSTTDYSGLEVLLDRLVHEKPEVRISLPSLRVDSAAVRLAHLVSPTGPSLTLAPEAGSQRMRDIINKNIDEADVLSAAEEAFRSGRTTLKLYFIIGFPLETDEDVVAIADLCLRIRDVGRKVLGSRASRLQLNVSVNNFVPKPFTPFQWAGMADQATLRSRQELLRSRLRRPGIRLAFHDVDKSHLEAFLARGGVETAAVVEAAWRHGARFDSWTEQFCREAWDTALSSAGFSVEEMATMTMPRDAQFPWDVISGGVDRDFLWREWERAMRAETTPDCRWDDCSVCGVCDGGLANDLAVDAHDSVTGVAEVAEVAEVAGPVGPVGVVTPAKDVIAVDPAGRAARSAQLHCYLLTFSVGGRVRFVGHLDKVELFRRAVRRAGGRLALSAGVRPKPLLSLALPLAVGMEAEREFCEFSLAEPAPPRFIECLNEALPTGIRALSLEPYSARRSVAARVVASTYELCVEVDGAGAALVEAAQRLAAAPSLPVRDERGDKVRTVDVKTYVDAVDVQPGEGGAYVLRFRVAVTPRGSVRPERVVDSLVGLGAPPLTIKTCTRTRLELR